MLAEYRGTPVFMAEDVGFCTHVRHHQQKLVLFLAARRARAERLRKAGFEVDYRRLDVGGEQACEGRLRKARILAAAEAFLERVTASPD